MFKISRNTIIICITIFLLLLIILKKCENYIMTDRTKYILNEVKKENKELKQKSNVYDDIDHALDLENLCKDEGCTLAFMANYYSSIDNTDKIVCRLRHYPKDMILTQKAGSGSCTDSAECKWYQPGTWNGIKDYNPIVVDCTNTVMDKVYFKKVGKNKVNMYTINEKTGKKCGIDIVPYNGPYYGKRFLSGLNEYLAYRNCNNDPNRVIDIKGLDKKTSPLRTVVPKFGDPKGKLIQLSTNIRDKDCFFQFSWNGDAKSGVNPLKFDCGNKIKGQVGNMAMADAISVERVSKITKYPQNKWDMSVYNNLRGAMGVANNIK